MCAPTGQPRHPHCGRHGHFDPGTGAGLCCLSSSPDLLRPLLSARRQSQPPFLLLPSSFCGESVHPSVTGGATGCVPTPRTGAGPGPSTSSAPGFRPASNRRCYFSTLCFSTRQRPPDNAHLPSSCPDPSSRVLPSRLRRSVPRSSVGLSPLLHFCHPHHGDPWPPTGSLCCLPPRPQPPFLLRRGASAGDRRCSLSPTNLCPLPAADGSPARADAHALWGMRRKVSDGRDVFI